MYVYVIVFSGVAWMFGLTDLGSLNFTDVHDDGPQGPGPAVLDHVEVGPNRAGLHVLGCQARTSWSG